MKTIATALLAAFAASAALALDITTRDGRVFTDVEVRRVEPDGITVKHSSGLEKIHARYLSDEDRAKYNLTPEAARAYAQRQHDAFARQEAARREKQAAEEREKKLQANARDYDLRCFSSKDGVVHAFDDDGTDYIIKGYEAMPSTYFRIFAAPLGRVQLGATSSAIELIPVKRPPPPPPKAKPTTTVGPPVF